MDGYLANLRLPLPAMFQRDESVEPASVSESEPAGTTSATVPVRQRHRHREEESDDESSEDEMELIGRFPFSSFFSPRPIDESGAPSPSRPGLMSLEHYHWLIQRYLAPHGEPSGIVAAEEPSQPPPIEHVDMVASAGSPRHHRRRRRRKSERSLADTRVVLSEPELRQRIVDIKALNLPDRDRDIMVQKLMTENYYRIKGLVVGPHESDSEDGDASEWDEDGDDDEVLKADHPLTDSDKLVTYWDGGMGCEHYLRNCKLQCSTCNKWYPCRICHDEQEDHKLIRQDTKNMLCMNCTTVQTAAQECRKCHLVLARYYCDICKLWDNDPSKAIYHCPDCGICRIGNGLGKDFFHCQTCNVCMSIDLENSHRCIEHSTECDCPICGEFMFTSTETVVFMKCGHSIHQSCYVQHTKTSYKCPTCQRSVINMEASFRILDAEIDSQRLPEPYVDWRSIIVCNDCSAKSNVPFHFLGLKCPTCRSYNTSQLKLLKPEDFDASGDADVSGHQLLSVLVDSTLESSDVLTDLTNDSESDSMVTAVRE